MRAIAMSPQCRRRTLAARRYAGLPAHPRQLPRSVATSASIIKSRSSRRTIPTNQLNGTATGLKVRGTTISPTRNNRSMRASSVNTPPRSRPTMPSYASARGCGWQSVHRARWRRSTATPATMRSGSELMPRYTFDVTKGVPLDRRLRRRPSIRQRGRTRLRRRRRHLRHAGVQHQLLSSRSVPLFLFAVPIEHAQGAQRVPAAGPPTPVSMSKPGAGRSAMDAVERPAPVLMRAAAPPPPPPRRRARPA